jgi:alcohol dehydrogenase
MSSNALMRAWRLAAPGGAFAFSEVPLPTVRAGTVLVRIEAAPILSYLREYVEGRLPTYQYPPGPFTPGTNGVGIVVSVGSDVWHFRPGQRVLLSPHILATDNVEEPAQVLSGLTGISADSGPLLETWRDGTLAEYTLAPATAVSPVDDDTIPVDALGALGKLAVPFGGLLRGRLMPGEVLVVVGATGSFGSAAVLLGNALGAERIVAAARNAAALQEVADRVGKRVHPVILTGNVESDAAALRQAAAGGAHLAFDMVGRAKDANATIAGLKSLRRGGRLVLMGSMTAPLPLTYGEVMRNNWEIIGNFMYPADVFRRILSLVRAGLLNLDVIQVKSFSLIELPAAIEAASNSSGLQSTIVKPASK